MRVLDQMLATSMAPVGVALGVAGVLTLELAFLGSWAAGGLMIAILMVLDLQREAQGYGPWTVQLARFRMRSRRAKRAARNLFCSGFVVGVIACAVFAPDMYF